MQTTESTYFTTELRRQQNMRHRCCQYRTLKWKYYEDTAFFIWGALSASPFIDCLFLLILLYFYYCTRSHYFIIQHYYQVILIQNNLLKVRIN